MNCFYCVKDTRSSFLFLNTGAHHYCGVCGPHKGLCSEHQNNTINFNLNDPQYGTQYDLCPEYYKWLIDVANRITTVKGFHVGGHRTKRTIGRMETRWAHDDQDSAIWELKYNAALNGENAILTYTSFHTRQPRETISIKNGRRLELLERSNELNNLLLV